MSKEKSDSSDGNAEYNTWAELKKIMIASSTSGALARVPCHPLDTVKARLQAQAAEAVGRAGTVPEATLRRAFRSLAEEGVGGFYRGFPVAFVGSLPATCLYLCTYEEAKRWLTSFPLWQRVPALAQFVSGFAAESVSCVLWVPIDVVKERMQVQSRTTNSPYKGNTDAMRTILRLEGWKGLYRGYGSTLASFGSYSAFMFLFSEQSRAGLARYHARQSGLPLDTHRPLSMPELLLCNFSSAALAAFLTNPLDLAKLRLQVQRRRVVGPSGKAVAAQDFHYHYKNTFDAVRVVAQQEGVRGLFKGALVRTMHVGPSAALTLTLYQWIRERL